MLDECIGDALPRHQRVAVVLRQRLPFGHRRAVGGGPVAFGGAVEVQDLEAHRFHALDDDGGRRRSAGRDLGAHRQGVLGVGRRVHQHVEHDRCATDVGDAVRDNGVEDASGLHPAQAHVRAPGGRDTASECPARAVEHRQRPQVAALVVELEGERVAERGQVGAAVAVDHALWVAGRAGRIEQADAVPLVLGAGVGEGGITRGDEVLVLDLAEVRRPFGLGVGDVDDDRPPAA